MHAAIYKNTKASAVVHTHSDYCVALSCQGRDLPGFHYLVGTFGGSDVPCTPYSTFGSQELADGAAEALRKRTACLLGSHGMICRGRSLERAVSLAHRLEIMCRQYVLACQLGEPYMLTDAEWEDFFDRAKKISYCMCAAGHGCPDVQTVSEVLVSQVRDVATEIVAREACEDCVCVRGRVDTQRSSGRQPAAGRRGRHYHHSGRWGLGALPGRHLEMRC